MTSTTEGFEPPPYPYDRLDDLRELADRHEGGCVDLSVGTPTDRTPTAVMNAMAASGDAHTYPRSAGSPQLRDAASAWLGRRFGVTVDPDMIAACVGTKELVASLPQYLRLREPERDTVLYPAVSYPTYAMGATLAGVRAVPVPLDDAWRIDLSAIAADDADRALCVWVNTPGNPAGGLDDLAAAAQWGRDHAVPIFSDECYAEFTWDGTARTILDSGLEGVVAVHSLSKRSNLAGLRVGFYAGDADLVRYLSEVRKHAGAMVPGPVQAAAVTALGDDVHVDAQRIRYRERLEYLAAVLGAIGVDAPLPGGGFYLWVRAPSGDGWDLARRLATDAGALVSPGEFYGDAGQSHVRVALVQPLDRLELVALRLGVAARVR
jgi:succinyldiaminopimelate transaminase